MLTCVARIDAAAFAWLNGHQHTVLDVLMPLVTNLGNGIVAGVILLLVVLVARSGWEGRTAAAGLGLAILAISILANTTIKRVVARPRPLTYFQEVDLTSGSCAASLAPDPSFRPRILGGRLLERSFPSGHAQNAFVVATVLVGLFGVRYLPAFGVAVLVAYSRIYVGAHFPADVLAGALVGGFGAWLALATTRRYWPRLFSRAIDRCLPGGRP